MWKSIAPRGYLLQIPEQTLVCLARTDRRLIRNTRRLSKPAVVGAGIVFRPVKYKLSSLHRANYERRRHAPKTMHPVIVGPFARIKIPVNDIFFDGLDPIVTQITSDILYKHYFENDGKVYLEIFNNNASTQTVTIESAVTVDDLNVNDVTISIPAGATRLVGPFHVWTFNQLFSGSFFGGFSYVFVNPSVQFDLKFRAFRLP